MFKKIFSLFDMTMIKFALVGIANTVFGVGIMFIFLDVFHFNYWISTTSNYVFGSILSYFLNKYFTFQNKSKSVKTIIKFIINISVCYIISYGLAKPLTIYLTNGLSRHVQNNIAALVGSVLFIVLNYFGQRFWAFKQED